MPFWNSLLITAQIAGSLLPLVGGTPSPSPSASSFKACPPDGPLLPRPTNLSKSTFVKDATARLEEDLNAALNGDIKAGFDVQNVSFSLALASPFDDDTQGPLWEFHHLSGANLNGTTHLDGDSQYLVGSISKVFTDLMLLKSGVDQDKPVTEYLPELESDDSLVKWANVTLRALGEHLSGIVQNYGSFEFPFLGRLYEQLGFPHLEPDDYPRCNVLGLSESCTKDELLKGMLEIQFVMAPNHRPTYSTLSFALIALALEEATGKNYSQLLDELVIKPLGLTNTGVSPGNDEKAVIPLTQSSWGADYGLNAPGGGLYSSINDLTRLANSILDGTVLDSPELVRKWLKPTSMTSSPFSLIGEPWEIQRTTSLTPDHPHTIDLYSKSGGAYGYISRMTIVDQYGVGFLVLTAGPGLPTDILNQALISTLLPAIEKEARTQAEKYTGTFTSGSDGGSVSITLSTDDGTGLRLDSLTRNGLSIDEAIIALWTQMLPMMNPLNPSFRIYPAELEFPVSPNGSDHPDSESCKSLIRQDWRINLDMIPSEGQLVSELPGQGLLFNEDLCGSWQLNNWLEYGGVAMDRIVFVLEEGSREVVGVEVPFLRSGMLTRVK